MHDLEIQMDCPIKAQNAGLFISRGNAEHPTRIIDSHELLFVIQGELELWEEDQNFVLEAGHTLHLWPGRTHGSSKMMPPDLKFYWIHYTIDETICTTDDMTTFSPPVSVPQVTKLPRPEALERLFRIFLAEQETGTLRPLGANLLTMLMLVEVAQQARERASSDSPNVVATWAHTYIRMNFDRPITASKVAKALGYNVDYLGRIYRQTYDCTLTQAIHRRRIRQACQYLLNSNLTVQQIAAECGFKDADYFRRIFKRHMQIAPAEYREENSRIHVNTH